ncbi:MAG: MFS transporter [Pseudonocardiales bacterium]
MLRETEPGGESAEPAGSRWVSTTGVATAAMVVAMLAPYTVSALGPSLVDDLQLPRSAVGALVTATFAVACVASLVAGRVVDVSGPRRGMAGLAGLVLAGLLAAALAPGYGWLLGALAVTGLALALANPATNLLVAARVPGPKRGLAIGVKQSGVPLSAFAAGLALPPVAAAAGWRAGMAVAAVLPVVLLIVVWRSVPRDAPRQVPELGDSADVEVERRGVFTSTSALVTSTLAPWPAGLMGFSLLLGIGLAAVNTYLPLYASQQLGLSDAAAGSVLASFGVAGLVARVVWTRLADRLVDVTMALRWLSLTAAAATVLLALAAGSGTWLVWAGAIGVGATATAANAVSMLAVLRRGGATGHASALVSLGFFGGFAVGPTASGLLADHAGWGFTWLVVAAVFVAAAAASALLSSSARRGVPP